MNRKQIPVVVSGKIVGHVSQSVTSIGASKVAGCQVQFAFLNGSPIWRGSKVAQ
jgi:hypothetical protein